MHYLTVPVILMTTLICSSVMAHPQSTDEMKIMEGIVMNCMAKEGASEADLAEMMGFNLPSTKTGQCLNACIMETIGIMTDGVISVEKSLAAASRRNGNNAEKMKIHEEVLGACSTVSSSSDRCQFVMEFMQCTDAAAEARGYTKKDLLSM